MPKREMYEVTKITRLREMMEFAKKEAGNTIAYRYKKGKSIEDVTYSEFYEDVYALGTAIAHKGITNKHIACIGENSYKWINVFLSVLCSDSVFVGIDKELPVNDFLYVLNNSESSVLFYWGKAEEIIRANRDKMPNVELFVGLDREDDDGEFLSFSKLLEEGRKLYKGGDKSYENMTWDPMQMKMIVYTSGTTGLAKGVMLSEHNIVSLVYHGPRVSTIFESGLSILPYHHAYESICGILVGIHMHTTVCINESLRAIAKNLVLYKPSYIYVVPAIASALHKNVIRTAKKEGKLGALNVLIKVSNALRKIGIDRRRKFFASIHEGLGGKLRKVVCGGAPVPVDTAAFFDAIGIALVNGYGITECSPLVSVNADSDNDFRTVGYPLPCIEIKIVDKDSDNIGEICVKGDTVMLGYYKNPEQTAEVLKDGWFYTGDFGYINNRGQLVITGRKKNIIVLDNGKNIYPEEIEEYIYTINYVKEVVVYDSEDNGKMILCAEVFPDKELMGDADINADICKVLSELPSYKQISKIVMREEEFKKNTSQKIKRGEIIKK